MRTLTRYWTICSAALAVAACAASSTPAPITVRSEFAGRSCDRLPVIRADTSLDSVDPLLLSLVLPGYRGPEYPKDLREGGVSGRVVASFVIDTSGRVPAGGAWIHSETDRRFGNSVCTYLERARFRTLVVGGQRLSVRVLNAPTTFDVR